MVLGIVPDHGSDDTVLSSQTRPQSPALIQQRKRAARDLVISDNNTITTTITANAITTTATNTDIPSINIGDAYILIQDIYQCDSSNSSTTTTPSTATTPNNNDNDDNTAAALSPVSGRWGGAQRSRDTSPGPLLTQAAQGLPQQVRNITAHSHLYC